MVFCAALSSGSSGGQARSSSSSGGGARQQPHTRRGPGLSRSKKKQKQGHVLDQTHEQDLAGRWFAGLVVGCETETSRVLS